MGGKLKVFITKHPFLKKKKKEKTKQNKNLEVLGENLD